MRSRLIACALLLAPTLAGVELLELSEVEAGQRGVGRTVLVGDSIEEFQVEILGVLDDVWPKQSLVIARLSGANLEKTGVIAGMSGSPVYIDDKLLGAVAFAFPFATEPLAGIRPIADMVNAPPEAARAAAAGSYREFWSDPKRLPPLEAVSSGGGQLTPIATPVSFAGFTARTVEVFGEQLRALGIRPLQGVGGRSTEASQAPLEPGSMISVGLIRGDMNAVAAGTVTHVDGDEVHAFGHRFLSAGPVELPMMASSVVTVVPNLQNSFKMAGVGRELGAITLDRSAGVVGALGRSPKLVPTSVRLNQTQYDFELARDPFLTPFLLQLALFSVVDSTERNVGPSSFRVSGGVRFAEEVERLSLDDVYSGAANAPFDVSQGTAGPLAFALQQAADGLTVEAIDIEMESVPEIETARVVQGWTNRADAKPGEAIEISVLVRQGGGKEEVRKAEYTPPPGIKEGALKLTVSDATRLNFQEIMALFEASKLPPENLIAMLNRLRSSNGLYLQVWREKRGYRVSGQRFESPPASLRAVLSTPQAAAGGAALEGYALLSEQKIAEFRGPVEGSVTLHAAVKE